MSGDDGAVGAARAGAAAPERSGRLSTDDWAGRPVGLGRLPPVARPRPPARGGAAEPRVASGCGLDLYQGSYSPPSGRSRNCPDRSVRREGGEGTYASPSPSSQPDWMVLASLAPQCDIRLFLSVRSVSSCVRTQTRPHSLSCFFLFISSLVFVFSCLVARLRCFCPCFQSIRSVRNRSETVWSKPS